MYDRTAVVRPASLVRYDVHTERVANSNSIVRLRYDVGVSSPTNVSHFGRKNASRDGPKHVILTLKNPNYNNNNNCVLNKTLLLTSP